MSHCGPLQAGPWLTEQAVMRPKHYGMQVTQAFKSDELQHGCVQKKSYSPSTVIKRNQCALINKEDMVVLHISTLNGKILN